MCVNVLIHSSHGKLTAQNLKALRDSGGGYRVHTGRGASISLLLAEPVSTATSPDWNSVMQHIMLSALLFDLRQESICLIHPDQATDFEQLPLCPVYVIIISFN